uniref:G protein-coupled receptor class C group 5 member C n=1 Tax=Scleropages formosus TaxID=113540 RepID=A0A8C9R9P7_SCLFO
MASLSPSTTVPPNGCGPSVLPLYYKLCDLHAMWGVVVESLAAAGVVTSFVLLVVLLASLPFVTDQKRRSSMGLQTGFLVCTMGLFSLTFAFIVGQSFANCVARRFLFGVLFAGCFACLLIQGVRLNVVAHRDRGPQGWMLCLGALGLWLVEVIVNIEWIVITGEAVHCSTSQQDFAMALIYVMLLLLGTMPVAVLTLMGKQHWRREGAFLLATASVSFAIWVVWLTMYLYVNKSIGNSSWDDPTLAITLVTNGWVFLILSSTPQICMLTENSEMNFDYEEASYENVLKQHQVSKNIYVENKAFTMEEPNPGNSSPYSSYTGQLRGCVYQPTELALISKGLSTKQKEWSYETSMTRITPTPHSRSCSPTTACSDHTLSTIGPSHSSTVG